jgi:hypothetical protein
MSKENVWQGFPLFLAEESKNASRNFNDQITSLQASLDEAERTLAARTAASLPRDLDSLEHLVIEHKEFETRLQVGYSSVMKMYGFYVIWL